MRREAKVPRKFKDIPSHPISPAIRIYQRFSPVGRLLLLFIVIKCALTQITSRCANFPAGKQRSAYFM